jgi:hypothetical protein
VTERADGRVIGRLHHVCHPRLAALLEGLVEEQLNPVPCFGC